MQTIVTIDCTRNTEQATPRLDRAPHGLVDEHIASLYMYVHPSVSAYVWYASVSRSVLQCRYPMCGTQLLAAERHASCRVGRVHWEKV